jgi:hypothetical protein
VRLWSLHPRYLDRQGLVALWREGLLARAVLRGETRGYRQHPQLHRFRAHATPVRAIEAYLHGVLAEADVRGYRFDGSKLAALEPVGTIPVTSGQLLLEWDHLQRKLAARNPQQLSKLETGTLPGCHPLFQPHPGAVAPWEREQVA